MQIDNDQLTYYCFLDPGSGKSKDQLKKRAARSAIVAVGADWLNRCFVRDAWADRVNTEVLASKILEFNQAWGPKVFGIESNAQQSLWFDSLVHKFREMGVQVPLQGVNPSTKIEKNFKIRSAIQPVMGTGRLFLDEKKPGVIELIAEMRSFPMGATVDLVDALASCLQLIPNKSPRREIDEETEDRLSYLREIGAPPNHIEAVRNGLA